MKGKITVLKLRKVNVFLIICMLFLNAVTVFAEKSREVNGHVWKKMKYDNKCYYLTGYFAGLRKTEEIINIEVESERRQKFAFTEPFYIYQIRNKIRSYFPDKRNSDLDMMIKLLNAFYSDKYNLNIKFDAALRIILARQKGDIEKPDFWLREARKSVLMR